MFRILLTLISPVYLGTLALAAMTGALFLAGGSRLSDAVPYCLAIILPGMLFGLFSDLGGFACLAMLWLPFSRGFLKYEIGVVTLDGYVAAMGVLALASLLALFAGRAKFKVSGTDLLILFICSVYLCSTLLSTDVLESGYLAFHAIFVPVLSYFCVKTLAERDVDYRRMVTAFIVGATAFSTFVVHDFLLTDRRVETFQLPPISIGTVLISALFLLAGASWVRRGWKLILGGVLLVGLLMTLTRVFLLLVLTGPFFYWAIRRGLGVLLLSTMLVITFVGTIMLAYSGDTFRPPSSYNASKGNVTEGRLTNKNAWKEALYSRTQDDLEGLELFRANPVVGTGLHRGIFVTRHNIHVAWLQYGGVLGYVAYLWLFLGHFRKSRNMAKEHPETAAGLLVIFTILTNGITNGFMHGFMPIVTFIVLGLNEAHNNKIYASDEVGIQTKPAAPSRKYRLMGAPDTAKSETGEGGDGRDGLATV